MLKGEVEHIDHERDGTVIFRNKGAKIPKP